MVKNEQIKPIASQLFTHAISRKTTGETKRNKTPSLLGWFWFHLIELYGLSEEVHSFATNSV